MSEVTDQQKLESCRKFVNEVGWFGQSFSLSMDQLVSCITSDNVDELTEEEMRTRHNVLELLLNRIGRDLKSLHDEYDRVMQLNDWHESGCGHDDDPSHGFEFPDFSK